MQVKIKLENTSRNIDLRINNRTVARFHLYGSFHFWGNRNGAPQYSGRWIRAGRTGTYELKLREVNSHLIAIDSTLEDGLVYINANGIFKFLCNATNQNYSGRWI